MGAAGYCAGCGRPLRQPRYGRRIWCSEACRKRQYAGHCQDCGQLTSGSNGRAGRPRRCRRCANRAAGEVRRANTAGRRRRMLDLRAQGLLNGEIAARLGCTRPAVASELHRMSKQGVPVPASAWYRPRAA